LPATLVGSTSATLNGLVTNTGGAAIDRYFFYYSDGINPPIGIDTSGINVSGNTFSAQITGLQPGTTYQCRAYAHNSSTVDVGANPGWGFGVLLNFTTQYHITLLAIPAGFGEIVTGAGDYQGGALVTVTAIPGVGYKFKTWKENGRKVSKAPSYSFVIGSNRTLIANFARRRH